MRLVLGAPAMLGLAVLALGPVLAHLARQRPVDRVPFGAMMLLRRLERRKRRRRRLRDLPLLLLRVLAVLAAVAAAARPDLLRPGAAPVVGSSGRVVIVLDDSLSMGLREGGRSLGARARQEAVALVRSLPEGVEVGVVRASRPAEALTPEPMADHDAAAALIEGLEVGWRGTDLAGAFRAARALLAGRPGEVVVFTDEAGPGVVEEAREELGRLLAAGGRVLPRPVRPDRPANLVVAEATYGDGLEGGSVRARILNHGPRDVEVPCTLALPDGTEVTAFAHVPGAGRGPGEAEVRFTVPPEVPGGVARVSVRDPDLSLDDDHLFHLPRVGARRVLVVDGDPGPTPVRSEVYFLERALAPWAQAQGGVVPEVVAPAGLAGLDASEVRVVFLANVADPAPYAADLVAFVREGGGLVVGVGDNVTAQRWNEALGDLLPAPLRGPRNLVDLDAGHGVPLFLPDPDDPFFRPFRHGGRGAIGRITARRVMTLEPYEDAPPGDPEGVHTLLRWEGGAPALVERRVGRGRVLLWTTTFDLDWSNAGLQAAFLPLVQRLVGWLGGLAGAEAASRTGTVGEPVFLDPPEGLEEPVLTGPDGEPLPITRPPGRGGRIAFVPTRPGAYALGVPGAPPLVRIAVNTPLPESDVRRDEPLEATVVDAAPEELVRRAELGPWALRAALVLLLLQSALAWWLGRRP